MTFRYNFLSLPLLALLIAPWCNQARAEERTVAECLAIEKKIKDVQEKRRRLVESWLSGSFNITYKYPSRTISYGATEAGLDRIRGALKKHLDSGPDTPLAVSTGVRTKTGLEKALASYEKNDNQHWIGEANERIREWEIAYALRSQELKRDIKSAQDDLTALREAYAKRREGIHNLLRQTLDGRCKLGSEDAAATSSGAPVCTEGFDELKGLSEHAMAEGDVYDVFRRILEGQSGVVRDMQQDLAEFKFVSQGDVTVVSSEWNRLYSQTLLKAVRAIEDGVSLVKALKKSAITKAALERSLAGYDTLSVFNRHGTLFAKAAKALRKEILAGKSERMTIAEGRAFQDRILKMRNDARNQCFSVQRRARDAHVKLRRTFRLAQTKAETLQRRRSLAKCSRSQVSFAERAADGFRKREGAIPSYYNIDCVF